jgi:hypothetical protein
MSERLDGATSEPAPLSPVRDQLAGAAVGFANAARQAAEQAALDAQQEAFEKALAEIEIARVFVSDEGGILGSQLTKHGEIAENVEVAVRRAEDVFNSREYSTDIEPNRTAPTDYWIDGKAVQSKYINGANGDLKHVLSHLEKYPDFADKGYYHVPKDHHELIQQVRAGEDTGLSPKSVRAIKESIESIEKATGKPFDEVVKPGISTYDEVQRGNVHDTLDKHDAEFERRNEEANERIHQEHGPSLVEGLKTAATAGVIAAAFGFAASAGKKYFKEKKNIFLGDFTMEDWKEVGLDSAKAGASGFVTGGVVYGLTNYAGMAAPLASAFVSAAAGIGKLVQLKRKGKLSDAAFVDEALLVCTDVALVSIGSTVGQALIPIPVLGALIGSFAGKAASELLKGHSARLAGEITKRLHEGLARLSKQYQNDLAQLEARFLPVEAMTRFAFSVQRNAELFALSVSVARMHGVAEHKILKSPTDVLSFLTSKPAAS